MVIAVPGEHEGGNCSSANRQNGRDTRGDSHNSEGATECANEPTPSSSTTAVPVSSTGSSDDTPPEPDSPGTAPTTVPRFPDSVSRLLLLNGRSISPEASKESKWKLPYIQSTIVDNDSQPPVLALGITEKWLTESVSEAQSELKGFQCIRSDRDGRKGGGCALYLHCKAVPSRHISFSDNSNNMVAVYVESLHTIFAVMYRPPDSPDSDFSNCMDKLQEMINVHSKDDRHSDVYVIGDFNMPVFNWEESAVPMNPPNGAYQRLMTFLEVNFLTQMVKEPTRGNNILDEVEEANLSYFEFTPDDIKEAIKELDPYSAAPDGDIPAKIICDFRDALSIPLWLLWKRSLDTGVIPPDLKLQYITPIYKKGNRTEAVNYRPVSLTSHIIKIFERVVRKHLVKHLEDNNILPDSQHGFRKNRSCLTQLIEHVDSVLKALNDSSEVDVIYLDYSKAFDKVDHQILLAKMKQYGINGPIYDWIECFLRNRKQTVVVDGEKSTFNEVESGVPQGTVLGPVFFIIYVIDLVLKVKSSKMLTFADDTKLMKAITQLLCKTLLQADLDSVIQWSISNNMLLHEDKFVVMNYCLNAWRTLDEMPFNVENKQYYSTRKSILEPSSHIRDLGVYLSDDCTWSYHINKMTVEARKIAAWVLGAFRDRSVVTMITLYKSLVRSKLEYCCPLWNPSKIGDIQLIENVQKQFTKKVKGMCDLDYWERLEKLNCCFLCSEGERDIR